MRKAVLLLCAFWVGCGSDEEDRSPQGDIGLPPPGFPEHQPGGGGGGGDDGGDTGSPSFSIAVSPESLNVPQGGTAEITVTITPEGGFAEDVRVTVDGLPAGVTASELTLTSETKSGSITLTAPPTAGVPNPESARVRGHASGGTASDPFTLTVRGAPGAVDTSFRLAHTLLASVTDVDGDGSGVLLAGPEINEGLIVCRLDRTGARDPDFGTDGCAWEPAMPVSAKEVARVGDGIFVAGNGTAGTIALARLHDGGSVDTSFGSGGWSTYSFDPAGMILEELVVSGERLLLAASAGANAYIAGFRLDGSLDETFGVNGRAVIEGPIHDLTRTPGGALFAVNDTTLQAFDRDGKPVLSFGGGDGSVDLSFRPAAVTIHGDHVVLAGEGMAVARFTLDGTLVYETGPVVLEPDEAGWTRTARASDLTIDEEGAIVMGGEIWRKYAEMAIGRRTPDGALDAEFGDGGCFRVVEGETWANDVEILPDGRYVLGGTYSNLGAVVVRVWN